MPNFLDLFALPLCMGITILIFLFRYWHSKDQTLTGRSDLQRVSATYWGMYPGTGASGSDAVALPQYGNQICTSCHSHANDDFHHFAK